MKTKRKVLVESRKIDNVFRSIGDLAVINNGGEFEKGLYEIHPAELE